LAPNPHAAALDQALFERNQLSSQNSQLWKLIEKQRSGYNQMLKELERVRAERDSLRGRVSSTGGGGQTREKVLKGSVSSSAMSSIGSGNTNGAAATSAEIKPLTVRHHSDDSGECHFCLGLINDRRVTFFILFYFIFHLRTHQI
jgi:RalA-binding protein 1